MTEFSELFSLFIGLVVTSLPFLLLGIFFSSSLLVFTHETWLWAKLPQNRLLGAILGSSLGLILPVGQYGHIPLARRLLLKGISPPIVISFLVSSPTVNPWVIGLTWGIFRHQPSLIFLRIIIAWIFGVILGLLFSFYPSSSSNPSSLANRSPLLKSGSFLKTAPTLDPLHRSGNLIYAYSPTPLASLSSSQKIKLWLDNTGRELGELGGILVWGCAIAAILQFYLIPQDFIDPEQTAPLQVLSLLGMSFWLSTGSWLGTAVISGFSEELLKGSILAFLLFSSLIDIKGISLMLATLRPKAVFALLLLLSQLIFLISLLLNFLISSLL